MSEQSGELNRLRNRLKNLKPHRVEQRHQDESKKIAKEAVLLFATHGQQEPLATFEANSESVFDLNQQKPGTIFRLSWDGSDGDKQKQGFVWFVVGGGNVKGNNDVYSVVLENIPVQNPHKHFIVKRHHSDNPTLILGQDWSLEKENPTARSFSIEDAVNVLTGNDDPLNTEYFVWAMKKLDVMTTGKILKQPKTVRARLRRELSPVKVTI